MFNVSVFYFLCWTCWTLDTCWTLEIICQVSNNCWALKIKCSIYWCSIFFVYLFSFENKWNKEKYKRTILNFDRKHQTCFLWIQMDKHRWFYWHQHLLIFFIQFLCRIPGSAKGAPENPLSEFEAKSGRDGAWLV